MDADDAFVSNISRRTDVDKNGYNGQVIRK